MGPTNPWSPNWRPDPSGGRLAAIRTARRGALLAGVLYLPVSTIALVTQPPQSAIGPVSAPTLAVLAIVVGLPGVALLGAGLAPAAQGSRIDAVAVAVAFAVGAPVAAVTSVVIGAVVLSAFVTGGADMAGRVIRGGVTTALGVAPLVILAAIVWVIAIRRLAWRVVPLEEAPTLEAVLESWEDDDHDPEIEPDGIASSPGARRPPS